LISMNHFANIKMLTFVFSIFQFFILRDFVREVSFTSVERCRRLSYWLLGLGALLRFSCSMTRKTPGSASNLNTLVRSPCRLVSRATDSIDVAYNATKTVVELVSLSRSLLVPILMTCGSVVRRQTALLVLSFLRLIIAMVLFPLLQ
jgi:hypothetical protein